MEPGLRTVVGMMREDSQAVDTLLRDVRFGELNRPSGSVIWKIVNPPEPPVIQGSVAEHRSPGRYAAVRNSIRCTQLL